jgi:hypothetical protein
VRRASQSPMTLIAITFDLAGIREVGTSGCGERYGPSKGTGVPFRSDVCVPEVRAADAAVSR